MQKTRRISVSRALAVTLWILLIPLAQTGCISTNWANNNLTNKNRTTSIPIWQITQGGTNKAVNWVDAHNPRFAIYDAGTPENEKDDAVLDKETRIVWMKVPGTVGKNWFAATNDCHGEFKGGRMGWRLPTVEELLSLAIRVSLFELSLPSGHPFANPVGPYWTSNTLVNDSDTAITICFGPGCLVDAIKLTGSNDVWCVRGGYGHDAHFPGPGAELAR